MADPWWLPGCVENLQALGVCTDPTSCRKLLCSEQHCLESQTYWHAVCECRKPYQNGCVGTNPPPNCCSYTATSPIYVAGSACYCCCGCFASDTPVAYAFDPSTGLQNKAIREYVVGDPVYVADDTSLTKWSTRTVQFSSGTGEGGMNTLLKIDFQAEGGPVGTLYSNRGQIFLMPDGKLKRAALLVPGRDSLVLFDGTPAMVQGLTVGRYKKGVHHIATSMEPARSVGGHLIVADGVVSGDFALQVANLEEMAPDMLVEGHADLPEVGTPAYARAYADLMVDDFAARVAGDAGAAAEEEDDDRGSGDWRVFEPYGARGPVSIPAHAQHFVTEVQARDILANAPAYPPLSNVGPPTVSYLFKVFAGFYPEVTFYLDLDNPIPNAYSFIEYGKPFVVVTGQLARTKALHFEGMAVVIAHELGHLYGGEPEDKHGYSCTGMADYAAVAAIIPYVWLGAFSKPIVGPGITQVKELFSYIAEQHRHGKPGNTCNYISIECRERALEAGASNVVPLPECAGGPPDPTLSVVGAVAGEQDGQSYVVVEFSEAVDPVTAALVSAYMFEPNAEATAAEMEPDQPAKVRITATFDEGVEYGVWAFGVLSASGHPLIAGKNFAYFTLGAQVPTGGGAQSAGYAKS